MFLAETAEISQATGRNCPLIFYIKGEIPFFSYSTGRRVGPFLDSFKEFLASWPVYINFFL